MAKKNFSFRVEQAVVEHAKQQAEVSGVSLNQYVEEVLRGGSTIRPASLDSLDSKLDAVLDGVSRTFELIDENVFKDAAKFSKEFEKIQAALLKDAAKLTADFEKIQRGVQRDVNTLTAGVEKIQGSVTHEI